MRYINNLNKETVKELEEVVKDDSSLQTRQRAQSILLSNGNRSAPNQEGQKLYPQKYY